MTRPILRRYVLEEHLSSNALSTSWIARRKQDGRACFLKTLAPSDELSQETQRSILARSWSLQQRIRTGSILVSRRRTRDQEQLVVEYPLLESRRWRTLSPEIIIEFLPSVLEQIFTTVAYLHCLGLVHCDLKLENFLYCRTSRGVRLVLTDLDFLCTAGASPDARIFGTPDHIAPEILAGLFVDTVSDVYSLGVSLRRFVERCRTDGRSDEHEILDRVDRLAASLAVEDAHARSGNVLGALLDSRLIDEVAHARLTRTTLLRQLFGAIRPAGSNVSLRADAVAAALRSSRVMGISDELAASLDDLNANDFTQCLEALRSLVRRSDLSIRNDYWHVSPGETTLVDTYREIDGRLGRTVFFSPSFREEQALKAVSTLESENKCERAFLLLRRSNGADPSPQYLLPLADLASRLAKPDLAIQYLADHLDQRQPLTPDDVPRIRELAKLLLDQHRREEAQEWIEQGIRLVGTGNGDPCALKLRTQKAWLAGCRGEYESAGALLKEILESARAHQVVDEEISAAYSLGVIEWRRGRLSHSEKWLLEAHKRLAQSGSMTLAVQVSVTLGILYEHVSQYLKAEDYARSAIKLAVDSRQRSMLRPIYLSLVHCLGRLGEFSKAQRWLQVCAQVLGDRPGAGSHISYYLAKGWLELTMGDLIDARLSLEKASRVEGEEVDNRTLGKVYQNLTDLHLQRGDREEFERCRERAAKLFKGSDDDLDLELLGLLWQKTCDRVFDWKAWSGLCATLLSKRRYFDASLSALHLLLQADSRRLPDIVDLCRPIAHVAKTSGAPMLRAVDVLIRTAESAAGEWPPSPTVLKEVYRLLESGGHKLHGMAVCQKIAEVYSDAGNVRLARKFLCQARSVAEGLPNQLLSDRIAEKIRQTDQTTDLRESLMVSFEAISNVFHGIKDRALALNRLVEFAVEETGAERGVLLLKKGEAGQLRTEAQFACDEESIRDIERISSSLPRKVLEISDTLIVDNALEDDRTKGLRSIIRHNILSVVCTPICRKAEVVGVLYLDHHTIPALFDASDLTFIRAIANFISVSLAVVDDFKHMLVTTQELNESRQRHGESKTFISEDQGVKEIFSRLPSIARSNAPVLLVGESGTGKEIIAEIIHDLSHRSEKPFVKINCSALPSSLVEAELFGVAPHTATNVAGRDGKLSAADNGTLFVDEIGDMPLDVQAKILRAVEYQHFEKVGSNRTQYTDIRFVYATNRDLKRMVEKSKFRPDLLYRINTIMIEIPPLRQRRGDIPLLLEHFQRLFAKSGLSVSFAPDALEALIAYNWPGNVRELMNLVEGFTVTRPGQVISFNMLSDDIRDFTPEEPCPEETQHLEVEVIRRALIKCDWNQTKAAKLLGMPRTTLSRKMKKHGLRK